MTSGSIKPVAVITALALLLALGSILVTRVLRAFTLADVLSVASFAAALMLLKVGGGWSSLDMPRKLLVAGGVIGLTGVAVKLVFVAFGIGVGADHAMHAAGPGEAGGADFAERLKMHIHHLFFNIAFLVYLAASLGLAWQALRNKTAAE